MGRVLNGVNLTLNNPVHSNDNAKSRASYSGFSGGAFAEIWNGNDFMPSKIPGCVLYLPGYPGGGTKTLDYSGGLRNGTFNGNKWRRLSSGQMVGWYDGVNDYIQVADNDAFSITTNNGMTVVAWISPNVADFPAAVDGYVRFLGKQASNNHEWYFVMYNQSHATRPNWISFYNAPSTGGVNPGDRSTGIVKPNSWVMVTGLTISTDSTHGTPYIYRNDAVYTGSPQTWEQYEMTYTNGTAPVTIGTGWVGNGDYFSGRIGEVFIFNFAFSANQIKQLYHMTKWKYVDSIG